MLLRPEAPKGRAAAGPESRSTWVQTNEGPDLPGSRQMKGSDLPRSRLNGVQTDKGPDRPGFRQMRVQTNQVPDRSRVQTNQGPDPSVLSCPMEKSKAS